MKKCLTSLVLIIICLALNSVIFGQIGRMQSKIQAPTKFFVQIERAESFSDGNGTWIHWQTQNEIGNLGFNIYRVSKKETVRVNPHLILGALFDSTDQNSLSKEYTFFDRSGDSNSVYYIESNGTNGNSKNLVELRTQYISDLSQVTGFTSAFMQESARTAQPNVLKTDLILPPELQPENIGERPASNPTLQQWVANQPGVKIGVRQKGLYRVTKTELANAGFNVNSDPNFWQLYLNGDEQAMNVAPNGDYVEFYGRTVETLLTNTNIYFLINGSQNGKRIENKVIRPIGGNVVATSYNNIFKKKERFNYLLNQLNGEEENFYGTVVNVTSTFINFNLSNFESNQGFTNINVSFAGQTAVPHSIKLELNGNFIGQMNWNGKVTLGQNFSIPYQFLRDGTNSLNVIPLNDASDVMLFESLSVDYPHKYVAEQNKLSFYTNNLKVSNLSGFTSPNVRLFDVTFPDNPVLVTNVPAVSNGNGGYNLRIPANRAYIMYAVEDSAILTADTLVQNFPSTLSTPANNADFIIISHRDMLTQANSWAAYRASRGMNVKVVDIEDIYDEFSFGLMSSNAIRDFLLYAKTNWQTQPNYVMLIGDSTYDPKNYLGFGYLNQVPTQIIDTVYTETGSDESLADFNNDGLAELSIGRISTRTPQETNVVFDKTVNFETNLSTAYDRGFMFVSDLPIGYDFVGVSNRLRAELPAGTNSTMVNRVDTDSRSQVLNGWNTGKYLVNWTGHGAAGLWATSGGTFFSNNDFAGMTNTDYSILTALTCLNGYFIAPVFPSLAEVAIKTPNKGSVAAWASTGSTTPDIQEIMGRRFFKKLGEGSIPRLGDLIRDAKTQIPGGRDVRLSWALFGDPTLVVRPLTPAAKQAESENIKMMFSKDR